MAEGFRDGGVDADSGETWIIISRTHWAAEFRAYMKGDREKRNLGGKGIGKKDEEVFLGGYVFGSIAQWEVYCGADG